MKRILQVSLLSVALFVPLCRAHAANDSRKIVGKPYPYTLFTHCAVDQFTRFDGSFWKAIAPPWTRKPVPRHPGIGFNYTTGTMTLLSRQTARFTFAQGYILFVRRPHNDRPIICS